jgi:hypothetical protein
MFVMRDTLLSYTTLDIAPLYYRKGAREGKRYYDLRRWMDAQVEESKIIYGCNVMMTRAQRDDFQKIVPITSLPTTFSEKMYFWPIRHEELKRNYKLTQNPGWQYYD